MVALVDVRRWNAAGLHAAIARLTTAQQRLVELDFGLAGSRPPAGWLGVAADGAKAEQEHLAERLRRFTAGVAAVRPGVAEAADAITGLHRGIEAAEGLARAHGFAVGPDGTVADVAPPVVPEDQVEQVQRERAAVQAEIVDRIEQVLRQAAAIDTALADVLRRAAAEQIDDAPVPPSPGPRRPARWPGICRAPRRRRRGAPATTRAGGPPCPNRSSPGSLPTTPSGSATSTASRPPPATRPTWSAYPARSNGWTPNSARRRWSWRMPSPPRRRGPTGCPASTPRG
jgi:hypothetical protein